MNREMEDKGKATQGSSSTSASFGWASIILALPAANGGDVHSPRTYWTLEMNNYFLKLIIDQANKGQNNGKSFSKTAWKEIKDSFNAYFDRKINDLSLKNHYQSLKRLYWAMRDIINDGFKWDGSQQMMVAGNDSSGWDGYIEAHPQAKSIRDNVMPDYNKLHAIFGNNVHHPRSTPNDNGNQARTARKRLKDLARSKT